MGQMYENHTRTSQDYKANVVKLPNSYDQIDPESSGPHGVENYYAEEDKIFELSGWLLLMLTRK